MKPSHHSFNRSTRPTSTRPPRLDPTSGSPQQTNQYNNLEQSDIRRDVAAGWGNHTSTASRASLIASATGPEDWGWQLRMQAVRPLPPFYPLDPRSTRRLLLTSDSGKHSHVGMHACSSEVQSPLQTEKDFHSIEAISNRISKACQHLSIQAEWDNGTPCATLFTMERVEMVISMYLGGDEGGMVLGKTHTGMVHSIPPTPGPQVLLIELQRRRGDIVTFYTYRRALLDAAEGKFDTVSYDKTDGLEKVGGRDRANQPRASFNRPKLSRPPALRPPSLSANDADSMFSSLKKEVGSFDSSDIHPLHKKDNADAQCDIVDKALETLNIAASLIKKDRVDARRLGMESLVLLTDPLRAGAETAKIASRVVLLGTAREDLPMGFGNEEDLDALFDESAGLGIRETILEMIIGEDFEGKMSSDDIHDHEMDSDCLDTLFNLGLSVLSNALHTLGEASGGSSICPRRANQNRMEDDDCKQSPSIRQRAATEPVNHPSPDLNVPKRFIDDTSATFGCDVLHSLIRILGQAKSKPHDAYHSARCLDVLFKSGGNSHRARARRDLDAKRIISAALEVGARSHAKLADASRGALVALVTDDENSSVDQEEKTEVEFIQEDDENEDMENSDSHEYNPTNSRRVLRGP